MSIPVPYTSALTVNMPLVSFNTLAVGSLSKTASMDSPFCHNRPESKRMYAIGCQGPRWTRLRSPL